jgi:hypothetical protein
MRPGFHPDAIRAVRRDARRVTKEVDPMEKTELAHRSAEGVEVTLLWRQRDGKDETIVAVTDLREGAYFEIPADTHVALDVYYHPFAYREFSSDESEESRLAA